MIWSRRRRRRRRIGFGGVKTSVKRKKRWESDRLDRVVTTGNTGYRLVILTGSRSQSIRVSKRAGAIPCRHVICNAEKFADGEDLLQYGIGAFTGASTE
jgi:hypothetical protein